ncbi:hypothetical protein LIA77_06452 [Sarocladium implicatum]|nr:hypothetical protein LIA77_06452 [Sarocladium implicatum]
MGMLPWIRLYLVHTWTRPCDISTATAAVKLRENYCSGCQAQEGAVVRVELGRELQVGRAGEGQTACRLRCPDFLDFFSRSGAIMSLFRRLCRNILAGTKLCGAARFGCVAMQLQHVGTRC